MTLVALILTVRMGLTEVRSIMKNFSIAIKLFIISIATALSIMLTPNSASAIVGGSDAEASWMVAVVRADEANGYYAQFCGGTLIDLEWVLTAAHCLFDADGRLLNESDINVIIGRSNLESEGGQRLAVAEIILHDQFDFSTYHADAALLRLAQPATGNIVRLTSSIEQVVTAAVYGWGVADDGYSSEVLHKADLPVVNQDDCFKVYAQLGFPITETMTCAGFNAGGVDACTGDSGGPLMTVDKRGNPVQIGIISWGVGCGQAGTYGVYTTVSTVLPWIQQQILSVD